MKLPTLNQFVFCLATFTCIFGIAQGDPNAPAAPASNNNPPSVAAAPQQGVLMPAQPAVVPPAPDIDAASYILIDANSGKILASKDPDLRRPPASLTKMMTLYLIEQALAQKKIKPTDPVRVSKKAWSTGGSRMFIPVDQDIPVSQLIEGISIASGNDATVAMAEYLGGSEDTFSALMNETAQRLGMTNTHYTDASGLPHPEHYSSAKDLATLAQHIINDYPQYYETEGWFSQKEFTFNGIKQYNRNRLLWRYPGADGLKTGHTDDAGYCLVGSAKKDGMRLIAVILGAPSDAARSEDAQSLLTYGFRFYKTYKVYSANQAISNPRVWQGEDKTTPAGLLKDLYVTVPQGEYKSLQASTSLNKVIEAPLKKGQPIGELVIRSGNTIVAQQPIVALSNNPQGNIFSRAADALSRSYHGWFSSGDKNSDDNSDNKENS